MPENSATAALEMVLHLLDIQPDDEVIVPAYTNTATASVTQHVGCKLVLVDSQKDNVERDYDKLADAITERTKVIVPVDIAGIVCDYDRIFAIVESKKNIFSSNNDIQRAMGRVAVMADCAHALGAQWHGQMAGSIADFSSFSFHAVKNFTTAEGGCATWRHIDAIEDDNLYKQYQLLSLHGQNKDALAKTKLGAWEYDIQGCYYKCNMTDIMSAMGLAQLDRYKGLLQRRQEIISRYNAGLKDLPVEVLEHSGKNHLSSGHLYMMRLQNKSIEERNKFIEAMAQLGVATNVHYKPLPMMTAYKELGFDIADFPHAYAQFANEVTLPLHTKLTDDEIDYIIESVHKCLN